MWFAGGEPRDEAEHAFLATWRARAGMWAVADLQPSHTSVTTAIDPLLVSVDRIAGLPEDQSLQVGFWQTDPYGPALEGEWGDRYLLDNHVYGRDGLTVLGLRASPEQFANWTASWLEAQLMRPVDWLQWLNSRGTVVATRWRLVGSDFVLKSQGRPGLRRRPPDRVERVR